MPRSGVSGPGPWPATSGSQDLVHHPGPSPVWGTSVTGCVQPQGGGDLHHTLAGGPGERGMGSEPGNGDGVRLWAAHTQLMRVICGVWSSS